MEQQNQTPKIPGWADIMITDEIPVKNVLEFFNVLNQRLATVEDNVFIKEPDGSMVSLTKHYQIQSEAQIAEAQAKAAAEAKSNEAAKEDK